MTGLILKDLYSLKSRMKSLLLFFLFFLVFGIMMQSMNLAATLIGFLPYFLIVITISSDENVKYISFALTTPVSRRDVVLAKYVLLLLLYLACAALMALLWLFQNHDVQNLLLSASTMAVSFFIICGMMPIWLKVGIEKSRFLLFGVFLAFWAVPTLGSTLGLPIDVEALLPKIAIAVPVLLPGVLVASVWASIRIYQKKEF